MSLSRSKPLEADRSHRWELKEGYSAGTQTYICQRCGEVTTMTAGRNPPEWNNCPGMKRSGLDRSGGISPVSDTNSGREHQKDEGYREFVRRLPCTVCGTPPPSDPAHVRSRGAGHGDWLSTGEGKVGNLCPLCRACHDTQHDRGIETFEQEYDVDLSAEARRAGQSYLAS